MSFGRWLIPHACFEKIVVYQSAKTEYLGCPCWVVLSGADSACPSALLVRCDRRYVTRCSNLALPSRRHWCDFPTLTCAMKCSCLALKSVAQIDRSYIHIPFQPTYYVVAPGEHLKFQVLLVDEISMLDADTFDALEYVARGLRGNTAPFGGIRLVLSGDFFQAR